MSTICLSLFEESFGRDDQGYANNPSPSSSFNSSLGSQGSTERGVDSANSVDVNTEANNKGVALKEAVPSVSIVELDIEVSD
ncbi:hypothetical protein DEO72_LG3g1755 [Vigna unguiculata]|uniref:Uncharacterized protein n=1 Tax=Vigna unguiculata TaxID=3917 RepID=A0A4D6LF36_VIGUN|nr:hypothetical protein DEO72_LG3g1755 [Vigna unguiculata]